LFILRTGKGVVKEERMIRDLSLICISIAVWGSAAVAQPQVPPTKPVIPLANAHAHNDYEHARPLLDALEQGFTSIEADVYLIDGQLLVAHNLSDVAAERTLEALYLSPLREIVRQNEGRVYRDGPTVTLLVDIKSDGKATYAVLSELLTKYASMISETREGELRKRQSRSSSAAIGHWRKSRNPIRGWQVSMEESRTLTAISQPHYCH
jgi:hypothetical protein